MYGSHGGGVDDYGIIILIKPTHFQLTVQVIDYVPSVPGVARYYERKPPGVLERVSVPGV